MPELVLKRGGKISHRYYFDRDSLTIGRGPENEIVLESVSVSRQHARITKHEGKYLLSDMQSANGVLLNGKRITKIEIVDEDLITLGEFELQFLRGQSEGPQGELRYIARPIMLVVTKGRHVGETFPLTKAEIMIGKGAENDIVVNDWFTSKRHAMITRRGTSYVIMDLESWRGTTVNGDRIKEAHRLEVGEEIGIGGTTFEVRHVAKRDAPTDTPAPIRAEA